MIKCKVAHKEMSEEEMVEKVLKEKQNKNKLTLQYRQKKGKTIKNTEGGGK